MRENQYYSKEQQNKMKAIKPNKKTLELAKRLGCNKITYLGIHNNKRVFSMELVDKTGFPLPTGLPNLSLESGEEVAYVYGEASFAILRAFEE